MYHPSQRRLSSARKGSWRSSEGEQGRCAAKARRRSSLFSAVHPLDVCLIVAFQLLAFQLVRISH